MANSKPKEPLDVLQQCINDVVILSTKAMKHSATQSDSPNIAQATLRSRMPEIMEDYHFALDDLESKITRAKAALLRDLQLEKDKRMPKPPAEPVVPQKKASPVVTTNPKPSTSPAKPASTPTKPPVKLKSTTPIPVPQIPPMRKPSKPMAPFPNMGVPVPTSVAKEAPIIETPMPQAAPVAAMSASVAPTPVMAETQLSPAPEVEDSSMADLFGPEDMDTSDAPTQDPQLSFTDMEFSLAPSGGEENAPGQSQPEFDLDSFNLLPATTGGASDALPAVQASNETDPDIQIVDVKPVETAAPAPSEAFAIDNSAPLDGVDIDLTIGDAADGIEESNFDDLFMDSGFRTEDLGLTEMEQDAFDDKYFGLE